VTIGEKTKKWFQDNEPEGGFSAALLRCFLFGVVIKRPDFVLMAEEVLTDGKRIISLDPNGPKNCWFLWFLSHPTGALTGYDYMLEAPYPHLFFAFKRRGKIRVYPWEKGRKDIHYGRSPVCTSTNPS